MTRQALRLKHNDNTLLYLAAFLIPAALMLILFIRLNVTPFGNRGVGIVDGDIQYVDFFRYYRNASHSLQNGRLYYRNQSACYARQATHSVHRKTR
ncbi:MAG: YfhO family protein [Clostridia bacterium]|nr:YfhO family protein [Clostridia bacterium]